LQVESFLVAVGFQGIPTTYDPAAYKDLWYNLGNSLKTTRNLIQDSELLIKETDQYLALKLEAQKRRLAKNKHFKQTMELRQQESERTIKLDMQLRNELEKVRLEDEKLLQMALNSANLEEGRLIFKQNQQSFLTKLSAVHARKLQEIIDNADS